MALVLNRTGNKFLLKTPTNFCTQIYPRWSNYYNYPVHIQRRECCGNPKPAKCKVAIVTGGARGIGFHIAEQLLVGGAQVVILGDILVDACEEATCKLNGKYGENKALFQPLDVTKKSEMDKIFKCTKDRFGKIDIVVNNAGILADKRWEQTLGVNINGLVYGTLLGFQYMSTENCGPGGLIINVSSILGLQPLYSSPVYVGTKHFIIGFTRSLGHDYFYKMSGVKVMAVCPGVTDTIMITEAKDGGLPGFGDLGKELACSLGALPPQPPEEVGKGVLTMIKDGENGGIWVSEGCDFYKVKLPSRNTFKPKSAGKGCSPKKPDDPCKKDNPAKQHDPSKKETPAKQHDPCKKETPAKQHDTGKKNDDKKIDPCKIPNPCKNEQPNKKPVPDQKPAKQPDKLPKEDPCIKSTPNKGDEKNPKK